MIKDFFDFPFPYKNIVSEQEEKFKSILKIQFGMTVKQTVFIKGAMEQYHLYVWYESISDKQIFEEHSFENNEFHRRMIEIYFDCYGLCSKSYQETYLYLKNFQKELISYAYGHAISSVKEAIQKKYKKTAVYLDYASDTFVIESDYQLKDHKKTIENLCYPILKKYDYYDVMRLQDVRVRIVQRGDGTDMNDIYMTNRRI